MSSKNRLFLLFCLLIIQMSSILCKKKVRQNRTILCGIQNVLLFPDLDAIPGARAGAFFGITPESAEKELFDVLWNIPFNYKKTPHYAPLLCYWLSVSNSSARVKQQAHKYIKKNIWFLKKVRLRQAAEYAFTPEKTACVLKPNSSFVSLLQLCKQSGHKLIVCSNWNKESFNALTRHHHTTFSLFDAAHISGFYNTLTNEKPFFENLFRTFQLKSKDCILIDKQPDTLQAARKAGITTIVYTSVQSVRTQLKRYGVI